MSADVTLDAVGKTFGSSGTPALSEITLAVPAGSCTAILGPSGSGKSTLLRVIAGLEQVTAGRVLVAGRDVVGVAAEKRGVGMVFQRPLLFPHLSVLENIRLALQSRQRLGLDLWHVWSHHKALIERAEEVLESVALTARRDQPAAALPHGDQRKLEVGMLMALDPAVYLFDEPTAGMSVDEVPVILDLIRRLKEQTGKTILLVEHKMDVVRELADRIIVLHNGALVADGEPDEVIASPVVQQAYLGLAPVGGDA